MSLFPRVGGDFAPLFRLLDDYDIHRSASRSGGPGGPSYSASITNFSPRFDVRESKDAYHLDGELPGINQKDIEIEFSDPQTLTIKGRTVREYHSSSTDSEAESAAASASTSSPKPATVEDAESDAPQTQVVHQKKTSQDVSSPKSNFKYWVSERSVGEFHRSFNFPTRVDQDGVTANLKNGVLSVSVPKAAPPVGRKITIE